ncbi:Phage small terminase subunit [Collimonas sp. OK607]|uniref:phage terminase small subunit n=1 Tax=Collimonas sp. OK607 TaxID=1798194 RepID=UPI0008F27D80|nr:phage terminase small subunit [Collimonas sp. OK607]SFB12125.1 Phage small terminase subunit [Collimonas sp. OK607]
MADLSPAQRHKTRILAERAAADAAPGGITGGSAYEMMLYKLANDRRSLSSIQSMERKIEVKATLLPEYQDWIDGVLSKGQGGQDDVFTALLVWHIDCGEYVRAVDMARYAVAHKLTLPDQFNRDIPTMLLDEFSAAFLKGKLAGDPVGAVAILAQVQQMTEHCDAPDQARAKLLKAIAYAMLALLEQDGSELLKASQLPQAEAAHQLMERAVQLFPGVGVKPTMERLRTRIVKAVPG